MLKVMMNNGKVYELEMNYRMFNDKVTNEDGSMLNQLTFINGSTALNPSHISSVEVIEK